MTTIKQGHHRPLIPALGLYFNRRKIERRIIFDSSCRYYASEESDINKLFGIGYFPSHHKNSARFGWKFNRKTNSIDLFGYCYDNGRRLSSLSNQHFITSVRIGEVNDYRIIIEKDYYLFSVNGADFVKIMKTNRIKWGYKLGFYFGGSSPCPHDMKIR